jgi:putative transposase
VLIEEGQTRPQSAAEREVWTLARKRVLSGLHAQNERDGMLPERVVRAAAAELGCSARTVRRWLASGTGPGREPSRRIDEALYRAYVRWHGNVAAVHRELTGAGWRLPSVRTLQRAFVRELRPAERAAVRTGEAGLRAHGLYVDWEPDHRNETWQGDHKQLDVLVIVPRALRPVRPWSTIFIDASSRAIMGWALSLRPSTAEVLAALRDAVLIGEPSAAVLGGVPERIRIDHGLEFCAEAVRAATLALGAELSLATTHTPQEKGRIERLHLTCVQTFLSGLPHYTGGRRDRRGRLEDPRAPLALERFVELFAVWVSDYNQHPHSELDGQTPAEAFGADPTPLRTISPQTARALLAARRDARVHRYGITHARQRYIATELHELVGETVQIAFAPHNQRSIEVYWRGAWICTAYPQHTLTVAQQHEIIQARREHAKQLRRRQRAATRAAQTRIAPLTSANPAPVPVTIAVDRADDRTPAVPAAVARVDLLLGPAGPPRARQSG